MVRAGIDEGLRRMRFEDVLGRSERSAPSRMEAAKLLEISERSVRCQFAALRGDPIPRARNPRHPPRSRCV